MRRLKWWIKGHMTWKSGSKWNEHLRKLGVHMDACPNNNKLYSAYDFWKNYSPINGA
jgi:hypothetical protein